MQIPPIPDNEDQRLRDLYELAILDTSVERVFNDVAELAATICGTPYAAITLVDRDRQWFKAHYGSTEVQSSRDESVCGHAILEREFFEVGDLREDDRFVDNPLLKRLNIRFYGGSQLLSSSGNAVGMLCVLDSEPRVLSEAQRHSLSQLRSIVVALLEARRMRRRTDWLGNVIDAVSDEIFISDAESFRYLHANASALANLGYSIEELRDLTPVDITPTLTMEQFQAHAQELAGGAAQVIHEGTRRRRDGEVYPVEIRWQRLKIMERPVIVALVQDITERHAMVKLKDEFISVVNHELRTPLTSINGAIKLLAHGAGGALPEAAGKLVQLASTNTDRLLHIVNDILDLEKIAAGQMEFSLTAIDVLPILQHVADLHGAEVMAAQVDIAVEAPAGLQVWADYRRLQQILGNLVSNALKFAPAGSSVTLAAREQGGRTLLSVTDHGQGIPEHFHARIFRRFAQADMNVTRQKGGSGLGLSIVKRMVEQMGGSVSFDSRPGQTTFLLDLPGAAA